MDNKKNIIDLIRKREGFAKAEILNSDINFKKYSKEHYLDIYNLRLEMLRDLLVQKESSRYKEVKEDIPKRIKQIEELVCNLELIDNEIFTLEVKTKDTIYTVFLDEKISKILGVFD